MATTKYPLGEAIVIPMLFEFIADPFVPSYAAYDPIVPKIKLEHPDGITISTYTFPANPEIKRHSPVQLGKYWLLFNPADLELTLPTGTWKWKWYDPDPEMAGVKTGSFVVIPVSIP